MASATAAGCAGSDEEPSPRSPSEQQLRQRVTAYWEIRSAGALDNALSYYEPSFRKLYSPREFEREFERLSRFTPRLRRITEVDLESGDRAKVSVLLEATLRDPEFGSTGVESEVSESWVLIGGRWWKRAERPAPAP